MTVYGYTRVSTVHQAKEGESLDAQKRQVSSYAISRGLELNETNIIVEAGVSGGTEFKLRPQGKTLIESLHSGDILIFPKLDRAFRNTRDALNTLHDLKEVGVACHFIDLGGDVTSNGIGAIVFTVLSAFASFERDRIASRIREVKQIKKSQGLWTGGRRPFGFDIVDGIKVPNPKENAIIQEIVELRSTGLSYRKISQRIARSHGQQFSAMTITKHLNS